MLILIPRSQFSCDNSFHQPWQKRGENVLGPSAEQLGWVPGASNCRMKIHISCAPISRQSQPPQQWWTAGFRCCSLYNSIVICCWNQNQEDLCCQKDMWPTTPLWDIWKWSRKTFFTKVSASQWKLFKFQIHVMHFTGPYLIGDLSWQRTCKP